MTLGFVSTGTCGMGHSMPLPVEHVTPEGQYVCEECWMHYRNIRKQVESVVDSKIIYEITIGHAGRGFWNVNVYLDKEYLNLYYEQLKEIMTHLKPNWFNHWKGRFTFYCMLKSELTEQQQTKIEQIEQKYSKEWLELYENEKQKERLCEQEVIQ